jgi:hypothetical protein
MEHSIVKFKHTLVRVAMILFTIDSYPFGESAAKANNRPITTKTIRLSFVTLLVMFQTRE